MRSAAVGLGADAVDGEGGAEDAGHGHARVEAGIGILEDDLHAPPEGRHGAAGMPGDVLAAEADGAGGGVHQLQDRLAGGGLAAAALADDGQRLAAGDGEVTPSTARTRPVCRRSRPPRWGKWTLRPGPRAAAAQPSSGFAAGGQMRLAAERRRLGDAAGDDAGAARGEGAAGRALGGARDHAGDLVQPGFGLGQDARDAGEQALRVGMARRGEDLRGGAGLHDAAGIHDGHAMRGLRHHARGRG